MPIPEPAANRFAAFARNDYSQFGEDGIVEAILSLIPDKDNWCVEFGAWDGIHLSNTCSLIKNKGYKSVLIEADKRKFEELKRNLAGCDTVLINEFVTFDGETTLDKLLGRTPIPRNFDFLSIDIDGNDYHILESLKRYKPKIICIEFNPTIPNEVAYVQPRDFNVKQGSSAKAIYELASGKGYLLAAVTTANLILVDQTYWPILGLETSRLDEMRDDASVRVLMFAGFDGTVHLSRPLNLQWHGVVADDSWFQILPKRLRCFSTDYSLMERLQFAVFILCKRPSVFFRRLGGKLKSRHREAS